MTQALLEVEHLSKSFQVRRGFLGGSAGTVHALSDISFSVEVGEAFGLVGESGCGKSTAGRSILRLVEPDAGRVRFKGEDVLGARAAPLRRLRREMQIVFQDPYSSLNPRRTIGQTLAEPMAVHRLGSAREIEAAVRAVLAEVGMPRDAAAKYPHEFSGGQRQRIGIAGLGTGLNGRDVAYVIEREADILGPACRQQHALGEQHGHEDDVGKR